MSVVYWARFFREEDGRWSVDVPDMPGCLTWGKSLEEAYSYLTREAIPAWLGNAPCPPARSPEEILEMDRFEDDTEPLLARVVVTEPAEALFGETSLLNIQHPELTADLECAAETAGRPLGEILAIAAREYLDRHHTR